MAKKFMYVCAGVFLLVLSYHLGANTAGAQSSGGTIAAVEPGYVYASNGDAYERTSGTTWVFRGNVFSGGPVQSQPESFGSVKARYR